MITLNNSYMPPKTSDDFENIVKDCLNVAGYGLFNKYGRPGQNQYGIDLYDTTGNIVCQCKNYHGNKLDKFRISKDIKRAQEKFPGMTRMIIATTAQPDTTIDNDIMKQNIEVQILYWEDFERILNAHKEIATRYYSSNVYQKCTEQMVAEFLVICNKFDLYRILRNEDFTSSFNENIILQADIVCDMLDELITGDISVNADKKVVYDITKFRELYSNLIMNTAITHGIGGNKLAIPIPPITNEQREYFGKIRKEMWKILKRYKFADSTE